MDPAKVLGKFGWKEGHGLGRNEQGMLKPLKALMKSGRGGVGLDPAAEISDHWWDTLYNKTANNISVEDCEDGVLVKSQGKGRHNSIHCKAHSDKLCYGGFLQSRVVACGNELMRQREEKEDEEEDGDKIVPILTDDQLLAACGGRTAHKAARHGLTLNGKLHRIELQEQRMLGLQNERKMEEEEGKKMLISPKGTEREKEEIKKKEELHVVEGSKKSQRRKRRKRTETSSFLKHTCNKKHKKIKSSSTQ